VSVGKLVLIIEDDEKNLKLVRDVLQFKGFRTLSAASAEAGIPLAAAERPDLILMDIRLPGLDGVAALQELRTLPETKGIPVVALTASVMKEERGRFEAAGFDGLIQKPIDVKRFADEVSAYAERGRAAGS